MLSAYEAGFLSLFLCASCLVHAFALSFWPQLTQLAAS